ncbi:MAG: signal transduction histidine kinase/CheY-like chemotaxis protein, partial [Bacillariaceae sp.]
FRGGKYIDYFALPDIHRGISKGGLAWSTKCPDGFCDDDIQFFQLTHPALTTIMRLHTNDLVLKTLTDRMESEIDDRTTELETANRKLEEANEEISRHASKQLEHFACMSHEIRTPLNCIVGLSSLLLGNDDMNEELTDTVNMVYNSADLVQGVVNDVLDYAKIESGHFELDIKPSDLQSTLNGVVHSISNKLQDKNVEVRTSYDGLLQKMMTTDSRRLQQILYNILGNAAKFSRAGTTIDLKVRVVKSKKNTATTTTTDDAAACTNKIQFAIKDYGKGIDENDFEKIFQPFSQASKETQTVYGGTGLGLSITKNLVAKLGGTISIKSEIEEFTEFVVELPYHEELFDTTIYKEKALETAIVILDPTPPKEMKPTSTTACDECIPFAPAVVKGYDLNVLRCSSWGELESKLGLRANIRENYIFLAQEDIEHQAGIANVEKLVGRDRCSWFTFGSDSVGRSSHQQRHFKTLTGMFPSLLLDKIFEIVDFDRQNNGIKKSDGVSENNTTTLPEDIPSAQPTVVGPLLSPGLSPRRKFATKYPPRSLKVLIADDNAINQKVLGRILKRLGVTDITIVDNGKKAVDTSATTKFDCIFMDMEMPVMGGLEACRIIVGRDGNDNSKVVFVTAHDIADIREKGDAAGAFDYISKPLKMQDIHEFLKVIEGIKYNDDRKKNTPSSSSSSSASTSPPVNAIKTAKTAEEATTTTNTPQQHQHQPTPTNPKPRRNSKIYPPRALKVLVAEDNIINQKVLDRILKRLGVTDITIVDNGKKAVDASFITKYDCILMDMQMPIMDGLEACKQIVKRDGKENARVVFVTAHALVEFKEKALKAGGIDFVTKPFKMEDIEKLLKKLEETVPQQKESSSSSHSSSSSLPPQPQKQAEEQEQCTIATKDGDYPPSIVAVSESSSRTSTQKIYEEDQ